MKNFYIFLCFIVSVFISSFAMAEEKLKHSHYTTMETYGWMRTFHKHKNIDKAAEIIAKQSANGKFDRTASHNYITTFWAKVFTMYPSKVSEVLKNAQISDRMTLAKLRYSSMNAHNPNYPLKPNSKIDDSMGQDMYWAAYHATGEAKYLAPIIAVLESDKEGYPNCLVINPVDAAIESLATNIKHDEDIEEILLKNLHSTNAVAQERIKNILHNI